MTQQELVDQNLRLTLGDLTLQLIFARARIAELEAEKQAPDTKPNGLDRGELREPLQ